MPRRILLLITDLKVGGTPTVVRELAIRLNNPRRAVHVEVACLAPWGPVADQLKSAGISVTAFDARGGRDFIEVARRLQTLVKTERIDTLFSFLVHANLVAAFAMKGLKGVRFFQSIQTTQPKPAWHWWLQRCARHRAERFIVPSHAIVDNAVRKSGIAKERFVVIPNAIDPTDFSKHDVFKGDRVRVGFLGRLDPVKRIGLLVDAMHELRELPADCAIFGYGPERETIAARIRSRGLESTVTLRGAVNKPSEALAEMDVLVLPSKGEGFGLVLIEAMACGVPVIASAHGGVTDVIQHEHNGLLVRDDESIANAVRRLVNDADLRSKLITNGLTTVREKFTWDVVLPQYHKALGLG